MWLKNILSALSGFAVAAGTASQSGANTKASLIAGAIGAAVALGNLHTTAPKDQKKLQG